MDAGDYTYTVTASSHDPGTGSVTVTANATAQVNVLLVPADLFWYRAHNEQEYHSAQAAWDYAVVPGDTWRALAASTCPLIPVEREQARRNLLYSVVKLTYRDLRARRCAMVRHRLRHLGLSAADWFRYLRPPRRHPFAGTPHDAAGEFIIPDWSHYQLPAAPSSGRSS